MKSKKLMAALSALTLGATMMGGMAMTASAKAVTGDVTGDGGFYAYYYGTDDGTNYSLDWHPAPGDMYDGLISGTVTSVATGTDTAVSFALNTNYYYNGIYGYIYGIYSGYDSVNDVGTGTNYTNGGSIPTAASGLPVDTIVYLEVITVDSDDNPHDRIMPVKFIISDSE